MLGFISKWSNLMSNIESIVEISDRITEVKIQGIENWEGFQCVKLSFFYDKLTGKIVDVEEDTEYSINLVEGDMLFALGLKQNPFTIYDGKGRVVKIRVAQGTLETATLTLLDSGEAYNIKHAFHPEDTPTYIDNEGAA